MMNTRSVLLSLLSIATLAVVGTANAAEKIKVLIVDGQNNHDVWPKSTMMMKQYLEESGLFEVDIARTRSIWKWEREEAWLPLAGVGEVEKLKEPKSDPTFDPDFSKYQLFQVELVPSIQFFENSP